MLDPDTRRAKESLLGLLSVVDTHSSASPGEYGSEMSFKSPASTHEISGIFLPISSSPTFESPPAMSSAMLNPRSRATAG